MFNKLSACLRILLCKILSFLGLVVVMVDVLNVCVVELCTKDGSAKTSQR